MNLIIDNQNIITIEHKLFCKLDYMTNNNFSNCFMPLQPSSKYCSPFVLALIGVFLNQTKNKRVETLLLQIENKLTQTPNCDGIYNFYGNGKYFYDVDSTSVVNTFFLLLNSKSSDYHDRIINMITNNRTNGAKAILTWLNRPQNNVDWFVNYNFFTYTHLFRKPQPLLEDFLISEKDNFFSKGSHYYFNICFPSFLIEFNNVEFNNRISLNGKAMSDITNLFHYGINILNGKIIELNIDTLFHFLSSNQVYFNSKNGYFSSQELNAAIILYLISKIKNREQNQ